MFDSPPDEPKTRNRYGAPIDLTSESGLAEGESLRINGDEGVGCTPNRNKQHGFHFTADNCIGCHACEAACSEKNDLPAHLSFRSVGYVEGGTYPAYTRMNISMACNHCDDPVCLKGCPTRAYTKFAEYGAVLQDPDICFGCGYCTWVCPYNAPQLDPVEGHVQKCNMCVDRLEAGLKPACVSACLGNALDFGVIEQVPENREQIKPDIPGFPDPSITQPNIRFQQTRSIPRDFTRTDSQPVAYSGDTAHTPVPDERSNGARRWNLKDLSSRENPLVIFTLTTQAVVGAFLMLFAGSALDAGEIPAQTTSSAYLPLLLGLLGAQAFVLWLSTQHLGKPWRFYRGFNNLRHSPLSREALGIALFFGFMGGHGVAQMVDRGMTPGLNSPLAGVAAELFGWLAAASGLAGIYFMQAIYRIKARPFWNHWQVLASFFGTMLALGAAVVIVAGVADPGVLGGVLAAGLALEGAGLAFHAFDLKRGGGEGATAHRLQTTVFGKTYIARNAVLAANFAAALALIAAGLAGELAGGLGAALWALLALSVIATALVGRALFYVAVVPTTMPGAFFWKNKAFEAHARETGLADMPQTGVIVESH